MSRLPPPRVADPPFAERPRPRTWAAVLRLAFDGDYTVPLAPDAQAKYLAIKRGAVNAILDRLGVDARLGDLRLDRTRPEPELVAHFTRRNGTRIEDLSEINAMLAKAT